MSFCCDDLNFNLCVSSAEVGFLARAGSFSFEQWTLCWARNNNGRVPGVPPKANAFTLLSQYKHALTSVLFMQISAGDFECEI